MEFGTKRLKEERRPFLRGSESSVHNNTVRPSRHLIHCNPFHPAVCSHIRRQVRSCTLMLDDLLSAPGNNRL